MKYVDAELRASGEDDGEVVIKLFGHRAQPEFQKGFITNYEHVVTQR